MFGFSGQNTNAWVEYFDAVRSYDVHLITPTIHESSMRSSCVRYIPLDRVFPFLPSRLRYHLQHLYLRCFLSLRRYDAFILQGLYNWSLSVRAFRHVRAYRKVVVIWNDTSHRSIAGNLDRKICRQMRDVLYSADLILPTWKQTMDGLIGCFPEISRKVVCMPWGISSLFAGPNDPAQGSAACPSIPGDAILVMFARSLSRNVRHDLVLEAMDLVDSRGRKLVWYFALGNVTDSEWDRSVIGKLEDVSTRHSTLVEAGGFVPISKLLGVYERADILLNIVDTDQMSGSILEGFATGSIPVLSDIPAYRMLEDEGFRVMLTRNTPEDIAAVIGDAIARVGTDQAKQALDTNETLVWEKYSGFRNIGFIMNRITGD